MPLPSAPWLRAPEDRRALVDRNPGRTAAEAMGELGPTGISGLPVGDRPIEPGTFNSPPLVKLRPFDKGGIGVNLLGGFLGGAAEAMGGRNLFADQVMADQIWTRRAELQREEWNQRQALQEQERRDRLNAPRYFSGASDYMMFDPVSGKTQALYDAPMPAEEFASGLGLEPGTPEYADAMRDYTLRGMGPTAFGLKTDYEQLRQNHRLGLEQTRQGNRVDLEGVRQGNRAALRSSPTYRDLNPAKTPARVAGGIFGKMAAGESITPGEQAVLSQYRSRGGRQSRGGMAPVRVSTPEEARKLPLGTLFQTPDGRVKQR